MEADSLPAVAGIYKITNEKNGKFYIGSSNNIRKRCIEHRRQLNKNEHCNAKIQNSWNKYGEHFFSFEVVENCLKEELLIREQYYMDTTFPYFNINPQANGGNGSKRTEEEVNKMSIRMKELWADPDNYNRLIEIFNKTKNDPEVRKKQSEAAFRKFEEQPELKEQHSKVMKEKFQDSEYKARVRAAMVAGGMENNILARKELWASPDFRKEKGFLEDSVVIEVLKLCSEGCTYNQIAGRLDISHHKVRSIWRGHCYKHIDRYEYTKAYEAFKLNKVLEKEALKKPPQPRLTEGQMRLIISLKASGMINREIGEIFGVTEYVVVDFTRGKSYKDFDRQSVLDNLKVA